MQTYWDLSERERAALSREGVERYVDAELMAKGCVRADPPKLEDEPPRPTLETQRYYTFEYDGHQRSDLLFASTGDAQAVIDLARGFKQPRYVGSDWRDSVICASPLREPKIVAADVVSSAAFDQAKLELEKSTAIRRVNRERTDAYEKLAKAERGVLDGLWKDWEQCCTQARHYDEIKSTLDRYVTIAEGNRTIALGFLAKAYDPADITEAQEWLGVDFGAPEETADAATG